MLDQGVACPARFAVLRESALWGFLRADRGAHWGALAGDAGAPRETQLLAERVCQLLDENDGFLAA
jgi:hypothetical protein